MGFIYYWSGVHPKVPYAVFYVVVKDKFIAQTLFDTHWIGVYFVENESTVLDAPYAKYKCDLIWSRTADYTLPGEYSSNDVARFVVNKFSYFITSCINPKKIPSMCELPAKYESVWSVQHDAIMRRLNQYALRGWRGFNRDND